MKTRKRISPPCPKCNRTNTYDINPSLPNNPEIQLSEESLQQLYEHSYGHGKYYCTDCGHTWKKYRGKKPYNHIKALYASVGGFPGPYFNSSINFESLEVVNECSVPSSMDPCLKTTEEDLEWLREELYKCDFLNWAEQYIMLACDGTHWEVRVELDTHCEIKTGSNHFPPKWTKFCKAVAKISGGEFC